jgi:hypothetical protein
MATQDAIAKLRFWHTEVAHRETTMYIRRDYDVHTERLRCTYRECTCRHTESIQSVHLEEHYYAHTER